jgi:RNA polymerase sigma-70 factor, ECF subfamily
LIWSPPRSDGERARDLKDSVAPHLCDIELLETSVAAGNSALQRARASLRKPKREWPSGVDATAAERALLQKRRGLRAARPPPGFASLIREDAVQRMPPDPEIWAGREAIFRRGATAV